MWKPLKVPSFIFIALFTHLTARPPFLKKTRRVSMYLLYIPAWFDLLSAIHFCRLKQALTFRKEKYSIDVVLTKGWSGNKRKFNSNVNLFHYVSFLGYESDKSDRNVTEKYLFCI